MVRTYETIFSKVENLMREVRRKIPTATEHACRRWAGRLSNHYKYSKDKRKVRLCREEVILYDILLERNISPTTAYRWLILCNAHPDLKEQLKQRTISVKEALREMSARGYLKIKGHPAKRKYHDMNESAFHLFIDDRIGNP